MSLEAQLTQNALAALDNRVRAYYELDGDALICRACAEDVRAGGGRTKPTTVAPDRHACGYCHVLIGGRDE